MTNELTGSGYETLALRFFKRFSRFEFALKTHFFLSPIDRAEADWYKFAEKLEGKVALPSNFAAVNKAPPKKQMIDRSGAQPKLVWKATGPPVANPSDLVLSVHYLKTIRNNLFHGGKSVDDSEWDDIERNTALLSFGIELMDSLAKCYCENFPGSFLNDYEDCY